MNAQSNFPKLHNAMWPALVGKGPGSEPLIDLDTMIDLTVKADVGGVKFDGIDIFLIDPHTSIDATDDQIKALADKVQSHNLKIGSAVAPIWGNPAFGTPDQRAEFVTVIRKACRIMGKLRDLGVRDYGVIRIDSSGSPADFDKDPAGNTKLIAQTWREACDVADSFGERLAAEGEICWGGMHSWKAMHATLEEVGRPGTLGFQADMALTLLYTLGYNAPEARPLHEGYDWQDQGVLDAAMKTMTDALRPWTIDFHVAQNDATVKGMGSHDKTGRHCLANDPNGKLDIARHAGFWLRDGTGNLTKTMRHICWDGCMFPNDIMLQQQTWNDVLAAMIKVRDAHGWVE
ncbi:MAG: TIM barrel protein [Candidatus Saccharibacteria bacterium]|nr:TIM barrel protein [Pseudorhodobacter sp.]